MKNLSRATVEVLIATTDGETISIVLFRLGKYPSEITDLGSSGIFSSSISLHDNKNKEIYCKSERLILSLAFTIYYIVFVRKFTY